MISQSTNTPVRNSTGKESTLAFSTDATAPPHEEGVVFYDEVDHSLCYYNDATGVTVNLGREMLVRVRNNTGADLVDGQIVYISGADASWPIVSLAKADTAAASQTTLGMVTSYIVAGGYGYVCVNGVVHDLDTHLYAAGSQLYLSDTTAGAFTDVAPLQPYYEVAIGTVLTSDATAGKVFVHISKKPWHPSLELVDAEATHTLPTTATIFAPAAMTVIYNDGFTYDTANGVITINTSGSYSFSITFNAVPPSSNKQIFFYAEAKPRGGSWAPVTYSGKQLELPNATETQVMVTASKYFPVGSQLRFYIWGSAAGVLLQTTYLDGLTTVYKPAFRMQMA